MYKRNLIAFVSLLLAAIAAAPDLGAQEIVLEGPLVGQPAVRKMLLLREGRMSVGPNVGPTLLDTYRRNVFIGGRLEYSIFDWLGAGVWGIYAMNGGTCGDACASLDTKLTKEIKDKARANEMNLPDADRTADQIGSITGVLTFQLTFIPLRGKLGLFKSLFMNADFYLFLGGGVGFVKDRGWAADPESGEGNFNCKDEAPTDGKADNCRPGEPCPCLNMESRTIAVVPTFGGGLDLFIKEWLAVSIEYRALPMKFNISGTDEYGHTAKGDDADPGYYNRKAGFPDHVIDENDRVFTLVHSVNFGLTFFITMRKSEGTLKARLTE